LGVAVVTSLLASLMVAIYFIPMLASRGHLREGTSTNGPPESPARRGGFAAWDQFRRQWRVPARPWLRVLAPWWVLRLAIGTVLELLGKLLLGLVAGVMWLVLRALGPTILRLVRWMLRPLTSSVRATLDALTGIYPRLIRAAIRQPLGVVLAVVGCGWLAWEATTRLGYELLPEVHQGEFTFEVSLPVGTPIEQTDALLSQVEAAILADREGIEKLLVTFGYDVTNMKRSDEGEHSARFKVLLTPDRDPIAAEARVLKRLRHWFLDVPDLEVRLTRPVLFSSKAPIVVEIEGDDLDSLKRVSQQAAIALAELPELADVEATLRSGAPEIEVVYDRDRLLTYGLNIGTVARQVRDLVKGYEATRFNLKDRRVPIVVRLEETDRERINDIAGITVNPGSPEPIPLGAIAELKVGEGPSEIRRIDGQRVALIQASIGQGSLG
ncbi:MAG: efflux RND transporter permease subunit, partial [Verrucomicrobiae bacterium]|nr:efflux RND transporter permease subunit [Verrucomicrobiae bacterium]